MKRYQYVQGLAFPAVLVLAGQVLLQGCGGAEARKDAAVDGPTGLDVGQSADRPAERLPDLSPNRDTAPGEAGSLDTGAGVLDGGLDQSIGPDAPADVPAGDTPLPPAEVGGGDVAFPDVPLGTDVPGVDGGLADTPILGIDGATLDAGVLDTAPIEANLPGAVVGWPVEPLDFGPAPCGGEAPAAKTFTLTNAGWSPVVLTRATFSGSVGYTTDAQGKLIAPAGTLVVTVQAPPVPPAANIPTSYDAVLTIETDIPGDDRHLIELTETAQGAILTWDTAEAFGSFGALAPGHTTSASFHVINMGNLAAEVALTATGQYQVTSQTPVTIGPRSASDSVVAFVPSTGGTALGTLSMDLATPVAICQPLPAPLGLTGTSINGAIALSAVSLSFATECNQPATAQTLTVTNTGTEPMTWTATLEGGATSAFALDPATSTLTPESGSPEPATAVTITATSPTSAAPVTDVINITTDAVGDTTHTVTLTQTPLGDVISVVGGSTVDLGSVPIASSALTSAPVTVTLRNDANANSAPAAVTLQMTGTHAAYFTVTPTEVSIPAGEQVDVAVTFSPGTDPAIVTSGNHVDLSATLRWTVGTEANCGAATGDVTTNATATLGQVSGIPGQLDFGLVNCGATGQEKQITITNSGTASYQVTGIVLASSTYWTVEHAALPRTLAADESMVVTVTPGAIPATLSAVPNLEMFRGTLTITTDIVDAAPHEVALLMGAQGAIIDNEPWPTDWNFGIAPSLESRKLYVPVVNKGNVPVTASLQDIIVAPDQVGVFSLDSPSVLAPNQTSNIVAVFLPNEETATFTATANLVLSVGSEHVFCQPLPAGWNSTTHNIHMQGQSGP